MKSVALTPLICAATLLAGAAWSRPPVVVELFTAQGCSSCGAADALIAKLADRPGVLALIWAVDYWDYLGWKDTFAKPEFTDRQRDYDHRFGLRDVFTPQVVVQGDAQTSGDKAAAVEALVREARRAPFDPPRMALRADGRLAVGLGHRPAARADVWLVRFDPREQAVEVKDGDNRGNTVAERNVVRQIVRLGAWSGRPSVYKLPPTSDPALTNVFLVQAARGGRILAVMAPPPAQD